MIKRKIIIFLILAIIVLGLISGGFYYKNQVTNRIMPIGNNQPTSPPPEELTTWTDPAEFSFQYPKSLKLNPHDEDQENYAHVELTKEGLPGGMIVWVKDTSAFDIDTWVKQNKILGAIDSTLGGEPAKKMLNQEGMNRLLVSTIRDGYLYQIEVDAKDNDFWNKTFETVSSSFKFTSGETSNSQEKIGEEGMSGQSSVEDESGFEEEVIE